MNTRCFLLLASLFAVVVHADIAPVRHDTYSIYPVEARGVSLETAKVDIIWQEHPESPCEAKAVFKFNNTTGKPQKIHVGFPMLKHYGSDELYGTCDYKISFNGGSTEKLGTSKYIVPGGEPDNRGYIDKDEREVEWFGKIMEFPAGESECTVTYQIPLSYTYNYPYRKQLHYFLHTGSGWAGEIKEETVTIHFEQFPHYKLLKPDKDFFLPHYKLLDTYEDGFSHCIDERKIERNRTTEGYEIGVDNKGRISITWKFVDFEPTGDNDIFIEALDSGALSDLRCLEWIHEEYPKDRMATLALVKHYFALGNRRGSWSRDPYLLTKYELDRAINAIADSSDKEFILGAYENIENHHYQCVMNDNKMRERLDNILNQVGYRSAPSSEYVSTGVKLIEDYLKDHPDDEYAWQIYLENVDRFRRGWGNEANQKMTELHEQALKECPDSKGLLWRIKGDDGFRLFGFEAYQRSIGVNSGVFPSYEFDRP